MRASAPRKAPASGATRKRCSTWTALVKTATSSSPATSAAAARSQRAGILGQRPAVDRDAQHAEAAALDLLHEQRRRRRRTPARRRARRSPGPDGVEDRERLAPGVRRRDGQGARHAELAQRRERLRPARDDRHPASAASRRGAASPASAASARVPTPVSRTTAPTSPRSRRSSSSRDGRALRQARLAQRGGARHQRAVAREQRGELLRAPRLEGHQADAGERTRCHGPHTAGRSPACQRACASDRRSARLHPCDASGAPPVAARPRGTETRTGPSAPSGAGCSISRAWADERYRIPGEPIPPEAEPPADDQERGRS